MQTTKRIIRKATGKLCLTAAFIVMLALLAGLSPANGADKSVRVVENYLREYWYILLVLLLVFVSSLSLALSFMCFNRRLSAEIAEKKRAQDVLAQQNIFMRNIIDSISNPFYVISLSDYSLVLANRAAAPDGLRNGVTCHELTHRSSRPCNGSEHPCIIEKVKKSRSAVVLEHLHYDIRGIRKDFEVRGYPVFSADGDLVQVIEHSIDISERKSAMTQLQQQQQQLEELNLQLEKKIAAEVEKSREKDRIMVNHAHLADLGQLAAGITHEINTPLTYIKGNIELLKMDVASSSLSNNDEVSELFAAIEDGVKRISSIIESMKELSGHSNKEKVQANVYCTLIYANRMVHNRAKQISNIYINGRLFDMSLDRDTEICMAPITIQSVEQVWIIILNNALDELAKSGKPFDERYIDIAIKNCCDNIYISIGDNAGGIPAGNLEKVFEMFFSTKVQKGTGLGLHIAKTIIESHGGLISVSNDNNGAVFSIELPVTAAMEVTCSSDKKNSS